MLNWSLGGNSSFQSYLEVIGLLFGYWWSLMPCVIARINYTILDLIGSVCVVIEPWLYDEEIKSTLLVFRCGCFDCDRGWMYVVICLSLVACELEVLFWLVHVLNYVR